MSVRARFRFLPSVLQARRIESVRVLRAAVAAQADDVQIATIASIVRDLGAVDPTLDWEVIEAAKLRLELRTCLSESVATGDRPSIARAWARLQAFAPGEVEHEMDETGRSAFHEWGRQLREQSGKKRSVNSYE